MNEDSLLAEAFVSMMKKQKEITEGAYEQVEVPPKSKKEFWAYVVSNTGDFAIGLVVSPFLFFASFTVVSGSYGGTFWKALRWSSVELVKSLWEIGMTKPLHEWKRTYGMIQEPVYQKVPKHTSSVIRTSDEILDAVAKLIT